VEEPVLVKPFTQEELLRQVEAALTRAPKGTAADAPHLPF
jgi:DNA-binding response OmpR family regulator